jgi:hypothetical protein
VKIFLAFLKKGKADVNIFLAHFFFVRSRPIFVFNYEKDKQNLKVGKSPIMH